MSATRRFIPLPPPDLDISGVPTWPLPFWVKWGLSMQEQGMVWRAREHKRMKKRQECHRYREETWCWCPEGQGHRR